ncbi:putative Cytochrome P450 [Seiridium cardinale]|uniref:Cytochrome P450 n=1 Tax=Seiridium cardinale TaxID=138064 RepID=A0ABR2XNC5_9PEZI
MRDVDLSFSAVTKLFLAAIIFNYFFNLVKYYWVHMSTEPGQLPPTYPSFLPVIGTLVPFLWNNEGFFRRVSSYRGKSTAAKLSILGQDIYIFQDRESISNIWRATSLSSPINITMYTFKHFFGVPERALKVYRADNSGPFRKPYPGSNVPHDKRIDHISHTEFLRALTGPGLAPTFQRFHNALVARVETLGLANNWTYMDDFRKLFLSIEGSALIEAIYGPALLRLNPCFVDDLREFDALVPWLARGIPSFINPRPYRIRKKLQDQLKKWYAYARQEFTDSSIYADGDGDPFWGSKFIRNRNKMFAKVGEHDDDTCAALDVGLCFGLVGNTIPAALLLVFHIFKDPLLLRRIRSNIWEHFGDQPIRDIDAKKLLDIPALQSVYAETLRLYTKIYVVVSSPQEDVFLGRWRLPKGSLGLLNSSVSHHDPDFWNTKNGMYPVDSFWADRFLVDPTDPGSGPINLALFEGRDSQSVYKPSSGNDKPYFSMKGLEASWFPYGGGYSICPGRHLAKNALLLTSAVLVTEFDIEFLDDALVPDRWRFGLGLVGLKNRLPFRIKQRV